MDLSDLLVEYDRARRHTDALVADLARDEIVWRAHEHASAIGWHLGHQAAVAHYAVRNLLAAEAPIDIALDRLFDSATPEPDRGELPPTEGILDYRSTIAARVHAIVGRVRDREVEAADQLGVVAAAVVGALVNHEYQHDAWIGEVRREIGRAEITTAPSPSARRVDGYWLLTT